MPSQPGYFAAGGDALEEPCTAPPGKYCAGHSASSDGDTDCPAGAYCIGFHFVAQPCTAAAGFYCPPGSDSSAGVVCEAGFACLGGDQVHVFFFCLADVYVGLLDELCHL